MRKIKGSFERILYNTGGDTLAITIPVLERKKNNLKSGDIIKVDYEIVVRGDKLGKQTNK